MFGAAGTLVNISTRAQNLGKVRSFFGRHAHTEFSYYIRLKPARYSIDNWDTMMMKRDKQLTGHLRGQSVRKLLYNFVVVYL